MPACSLSIWLGLLTAWWLAFQERRLLKEVSRKLLYSLLFETVRVERGQGRKVCDCLKTVAGYFIFSFVEVFTEYVTALLLAYVLVFGLKACGI